MEKQEERGMFFLSIKGVKNDFFDYQDEIQGHNILRSLRQNWQLT